LRPIREYLVQTELVFEEHQGGTRGRDRVRHRPRGGALVHWLVVRRDVARIFRYRQRRLAELFI
jgi:hypothetical protein